MTKTAIKQLRRLPVTQRIEMVDELLHSIALDQRDIPVTNEQKTMIDERLEEIEKHPRRGTPLPAFRKKLKQLSSRLKRATRRKSA